MRDLLIKGLIDATTSSCTDRKSQRVLDSSVVGVDRATVGKLRISSPCRTGLSAVEEKKGGGCARKKGDGCTGRRGYIPSRGGVDEISIDHVRRRMQIPAGATRA